MSQQSKTKALPGGLVEAQTGVCAMTSRTHDRSQGYNQTPKETMMTQHHEQRRKQAIARYLADVKIDDICQQMACSKSWLYKWKARYQPDDPVWAREISRRPKPPVAKTPDRIEHAVVDLRQTLARNGQSCGAAAIRQALEQQGIEPVPSLRTIYRILQRCKKEG